MTLTGGGTAATAAAPAGLRKVRHIVVVYLENWSFDSLYAHFPGADGLAQAASAPRQVSKSGQPYATLPLPLASAPGAKPTNPRGMPDPPRRDRPTRSRGLLIFVQSGSFSWSYYYV
jgi:phospholipase C